MEKDKSKVNLLIKIESIQKLNEQLTAENSRLINERDKLEERIERQANYYLDIFSHNDKVLCELQTIKSKWWYKLMTWGW